MAWRRALTLFQSVHFMIEPILVLLQFGNLTAQVGLVVERVVTWHGCLLRPDRPDLTPGRLVGDTGVVAPQLSPGSSRVSVNGKRPDSSQDVFIVQPVLS